MGYNVVILDYPFVIIYKVDKGDRKTKLKKNGH